jgi:hypothetical protein
LAGLGKLEVLWLTRCGISDESVEVLSRLRALKELNVSYTGVSAKGLHRLRTALPECRLVEPD